MWVLDTSQSRCRKGKLKRKTVTVQVFQIHVTEQPSVQRSEAREEDKPETGQEVRHFVFLKSCKFQG